MKFVKLQATGNDFILLDALHTSLTPGKVRAADDGWSNLARVMCDRHFGVGADGLIVVEPSIVANAKMRIFNPDGSEAEVCGNGLRCVAKYIVEKNLSTTHGLLEPSKQANYRVGMSPPFTMTVETLSGIRQIRAFVAGGRVDQVEVNMGVPRFEPEQIPVDAKLDVIPVLEYPLVIGRSKLKLALLSMGNPHAVSFISRPVDQFPLAKIGPRVERHRIFPHRTNFAVARIVDSTRIEARIWERGVGETLACGSGACAVAVAAQLLKRVGPEVDIILKGGTLTVIWEGTGDVLLRGPVKKVFVGEWLQGKVNETS
jgi:diaminopimelate epimerase